MLPLPRDSPRRAPRGQQLKLGSCRPYNQRMHNDIQIFKVYSLTLLTLALRINALQLAVAQTYGRRA